uniref:Transferrin receptor 1b n=1 Tax=Cynoglossus semilaevis TaxID=244447 RepID=A0A3P8WXB1_CYNSE
MERVRGAFNNLVSDCKFFSPPFSYFFPATNAQFILCRPASLQLKSESYSRFNLQPQVEGETHMEAKMSDDVTDDVTQVESQAGAATRFEQTSSDHNKRNICYLSLGTLLVFLLDCCFVFFYIKGKLVYANYGRLEDLDVVLKKDIELNGSVLLLRKGKISYAEKVQVSKGASAVLIYPDIQDYKYEGDTALYGHVHLGCGDPYTPGFPSFNHTLFPPTKSSGLPEIPAQTITSNASSGFIGGFHMPPYRLGGSKNITVEVNNILVNTKIRNVFGVIKGFTDPDQYLVIGAQRDAWGRGYARANVGTCVLIELARAFSEMVKKDGFRPRRSIVFASWSAGEYGNVGATEWLEAYMSTIDKRLFTYISLDGLVMGRGSFTASSSPLLYSLIETTMKTVRTHPSVLIQFLSQTSSANVYPMSMDDPAYPFLAFSGIPSMSFHFTSKNSYPYYDTNLDNMDHLDYQTNHHSSEITALAAQCAGVMALRLVHDHVINLDVNQYGRIINKAVIPVYMRIKKLTNWLVEARGSFLRAVEKVNTSISNSDLNNEKTCRMINNRITAVEHSLLSPYVSPTQTPFRHLLLGRGPHTLASLGRIRDMEQLHVQLALATWTLQGCSYVMVGDIWDIHEQI